MNWPETCLVCIPCLNESATIGGLVREIRRTLPRVLVIDDGSADNTAALAATAGAAVTRHDRSLGKGRSLQHAWAVAEQKGFEWVLTMDGDGQHAPSDISVLLSCAEASRADLVIGNRMAQAGRIPFVRRAVNRWMSRRLSRLAGVELPDTQSGFRLIRLEALRGLRIAATHFEIESEVLLRLARANRRIQFVPIQVIYRAEQSKINPVLDTIRWLRWWRRA
ncbi:MAG TPA: glycosyltransferase family 2 protein [Verrucomicrobiae bacterium]|nr:glycosyltransferase family 2 protein [Verrucomicrobiae bacterium]